MIKKYLSQILFFFLLLNVSCNIINPTETVPTFIQINNVTLKDNPGIEEGTLSHKITDVWVYADNDLLGGFEIPAKVPVLTTKSTANISLVAGVWENGLSGTRTKYNFFTIDTFTLQNIPGATTVHNPEYMYRSNNTIVLNEDFEQGISFEKKLGDTSINKTNIASDVFEGNWSGLISLSGPNKNASIISINAFSLTPNINHYLELNYKSTIPFTIEIQSYLNTNYNIIPLIGVKEKTSWNKIYIKLSDIASQYQNANFKLIFKTSTDAIQSGQVWIDNVKIVSL